MEQPSVKGAALLGGIALALAHPAAGAVTDPSSFAHLGFRQHPGAQLPLQAQFRDEQGRPVTLGSAMARKPSVVVLEYLHCANLCGLVLRGAVAAIRDAQLTPGRDFSLVAISIDPRDTPKDAMQARAMYAQDLASDSAGTGLHFLTGSPAAVGEVASAVGFPYRYDKESGQFAHPAGFVVTTPEGKISRYMLGIGPPGAALRTAIEQAHADEITPAAHPLLLLCFGYDPDPQTAAAMAMRLVRWVSLATVLGCALLIFFLSRRRTA